MMALDPLTPVLSDQAGYMEGTDLTVNKLRLEIRFPTICNVKFWGFRGTMCLHVFKKCEKSMEGTEWTGIWYLWCECLSIWLGEGFEEWYRCCLLIIFAYHIHYHIKLIPLSFHWFLSGGRKGLAASSKKQGEFTGINILQVPDECSLLTHSSSGQ